jgi:hypothetical protein
MGPDLAALFTRSDFDARQCSLQDRLQKDLSDNEVIWEMLKGHAQQTAREGNLARCRNVHVAMANHLLRRGKRGRELQALCIVCVFDLCGVRNRDDAPAEIRVSPAPGPAPQRNCRTPTTKTALYVEALPRLFLK